MIGRDYWPNKTLRQMPRHWVLEESRRPQRGYWELWLLAILVVVLVQLWF